METHHPDEAGGAQDPASEDEGGGGYPLMARCSAIKPTGERCQRSADGQHGLCWAHDPTNAEARRRTSSKGGRGKASREVRALKAYLEELAEEVRSGELDPKVGAVVNQIVNTQLRALEMERQIRETDELASEIEALKVEHGIAG